MTDLVTLDTAQGIATVTLNRPTSYNAITPGLLDALNARLRDARDDENVYSIVLAGAGEGFCAGIDMDEVPGWTELTREEYAAFLRNYQHCVRQLRGSAIPTVAAVDGPTVGGGCGLALGCDLRFVSANAFLRLNFTQLGIVPVDGSAWLLADAIGEPRTREYLLPGQDIDAKTMIDLGLAVERVESPAVAAREFAAELVDRPAAAVRRTNELVGFEGDLEAYFTAAIDAQWESLQDPEHAEAVAALQDDREPVYDRPE